MTTTGKWLFTSGVLLAVIALGLSLFMLIQEWIAPGVIALVAGLALVSATTVLFLTERTYR